jgi:hypothetical protein
LKKLFTYVENTWLGPDGKPSIKRTLAIVFSGHIIYSVSANINSYVRLLDAVYIDSKRYDAAMIAAAASSLSNLAMVIGIEAGLVAALLGLASYQQVQNELKIKS